MSRLLPGARARSFLFLSTVSCLAIGGPALAQDVTELPGIVVTADRRPEPISRTGSAISVVSREQIETTNPTSLVDALRNVPGLDITETGGPGATTSVRIRGANPGQTLVLIDGIRANDPADVGAGFDFANLLPTAIDRIEVLRGPQTSLYGSDAIGGVVNIITRSGQGQAPRSEVRTEAGSYGTVSTSATSSGTIGPWSWAFSAGGQKSDGFSRIGYRIGQLERKFGRHFEADGFSRFGGYGRIGYDAGEGVRLEMGVMAVETNSQFDGSLSTIPAKVATSGFGRPYFDTGDRAAQSFRQIFAKATAEQGPLTQSIKVYANQTDRSYLSSFYFGGIAPADTFLDRYQYRGDRVGTEYQGDLKLNEFGTFTFGGKYEREKATTFDTPLLPDTNIRMRTLEAGQATRSVFALYQLPIGERLILSLGGRHDEVNAVTFDTWRATAAYLIPETGTKLRASVGTGGKAPSLFQLFDPIYGTTTLQAEKSIGWDAGIDQTLLDGRANVSATVFGNRIKNLINFDTVTSKYFNTARAETSGVEVEAGLIVLPEWVKLNATYTYLHAQDEATHKTLARRPQHSGRIGIAITPMPGLLIEPRVTFVSRRFSGNDETLPIPRYGRLDIYSEYRLDQTWKVFGRIENVTDARYQEVLNYGTTGRAAYAGLSATW